MVPRAIPFVVVVVLSSAGTAAAGWFAAQAMPLQWVLLATALSFVPYGLLLRIELPRFSPLLLALPATALVGALLVAAPSVLSDDVYRYLWDARVLLHGLDPYAHAPAAPQLWDLRDANWSHINHRQIPTIYPPAAQGLFALGYLIHPSPMGDKLLALALHLLTVLLLHRAAASPSLASSSAGPRAVYAYALNPLVLLETALSGHMDVAVGALALALAWALSAGRLAAAVALVVGVAWLKLVGILLAPLLALRSGRAAFLALLLAAGALVPLSSAGRGDRNVASGLRHYSSRWQGNAGGFAVLNGLMLWALPLSDPGGDSDLGPDELSLGPLSPLLEAGADTPFDMRPLPLVERKQARPPGVLPRVYVAGLLAKAAVLALLGGLLLWLLRRGAEPAWALRLTLLALLLLAPQVHPWYLLWLLPLECLLGRPTGLVWSAAILTAYLPLPLWLEHRLWVQQDWPVAFQYGCVMLALCAEWMAQRKFQRSRHVDPIAGAV